MANLSKGRDVLMAHMVSIQDSDTLMIVGAKLGSIHLYRSTGLNPLGARQPGYRNFGDLDFVIYPREGKVTMLRQKGFRRPFSDIAFDALRGVTTAMFGQTIGGLRSVPQPRVKMSSDTVFIEPGEELIWDRRSLPEKKQVSIMCDCGGFTYRFAILRDHGAFRAEKEALGSYFTALESTLRNASSWERISLAGKCIKCGQELEAFIGFTH